MNWISVREKAIPEYWVFAFHKTQGRIISRTVTDGSVEECCCCIPRVFREAEDFTHWMPLPEPPKDQ